VLVELGAFVEQNPEDLQARLLLGQVYDFDGRPEETVALYKAGVRKRDGDFALWMYIGEIRARQGEDGPNVIRRRGSIQYSPSKDEEAEEAYKKAHLGLAAEAYRRALKLRPGSRPALTQLAQALADAGEEKEAAELWSRAAKRFPDEAAVWLALGQAQAALMQDGAAITSLQSALKLNPRMAKAYTTLAKLQKKRGEESAAALSERRAKFYAWLPPFARLLFDEPSFQIVKELSERGSKAAEVIERLLSDKSERATTLLAAISWHHTNHGALEDKAFAELEARGAQKLLLAIIKQPQSTCSIRSASRALVRMKSPEVLPFLVKMLPGDVRIGFDSNIAGALAVLGDQRAVAPLIEVLAPTLTLSEPEEDLMMMSAGRYNNRLRSALALGHFDTPAAREALAKGVANPQLSFACRAALYGLSRSDKDWVELEKAALQKLEPMEAYYVAEYLNRFSEDIRAKTLAAKLKAHR